MWFLYFLRFLSFFFFYKWNMRSSDDKLWRKKREHIPFNEQSYVILNEIAKRNEIAVRFWSFFHVDWTLNIELLNKEKIVHWQAGQTLKKHFNKKLKSVCQFEMKIAKTKWILIQTSKIHLNLSFFSSTWIFFVTPYNKIISFSFPFPSWAPGLRSEKNDKSQQSGNERRQYKQLFYYNL